MPICGQIPTDETSEWAALHNAAADPAIDAALQSLYADTDAAIAERGPTCWQSGKCCNFVDFGHLLYVTALEACWFTHHAPPPPQTKPLSPTELPQFFASQQPACPYQVNKACTTHTIRPLGCRIFFCQRGTEDWQQDLYESFQQRLRTLHDAHALPYRYLEWRAALDLARSLRETATASPLTPRRTTSGPDRP
ncbi:MAG: hypothetical protein AAGI68_01520 [Planctomycetota bacterium]